MYLNLETNSMQGHSKPHVFKFTKQDGKAVIKFKRWTTDNVSIRAQFRFNNKLFFSFKIPLQADQTRAPLTEAVYTLQICIEVTINSKYLKRFVIMVANI